MDTVRGGLPGYVPIDRFDGGGLAEVDALCPVCGLALDGPAWADGSASFEICPCCGTQFGYDDCCGGEAAARPAWYWQARQSWVAGGMRWWSTRTPPAGWDAVSQLARLAEAERS